MAYAMYVQTHFSNYCPIRPYTVMYVYIRVLSTVPIILKSEYNVTLFLITYTVCLHI